MPRRGERTINGKIFLLGWADEYYGDDYRGAGEAIEREASALRRQWDLVRIIRDRRRYRVYIYVFGAK